MIYGKVNYLFEKNSCRYSPKLSDICKENYSAEQFKRDLLHTFCEEPAYHYGFRVKPGHNTGSIEYRHPYGSGTFLDALQRLITELDKEAFLADLCELHRKNPTNDNIVHNLGVIFTPERVLLKLADDTGFSERWESLDQAQPLPVQQTQSDISLDLPFVERWERFLSEEKYSYIYRYFQIETEREELVSRILSSDKKAQIIKAIPNGRRFFKWGKLKKALTKSEA